MWCHVTTTTNFSCDLLLDFCHYFLVQPTFWPFCQVLTLPHSTPTQTEAILNGTCFGNREGKIWGNQPRVFSCLISVGSLPLYQFYYVMCRLSEKRVLKLCVHLWVCLRCRMKERYDSALLQPVYQSCWWKDFLPLPVGKSIAFWFAHRVMFAFGCGIGDACLARHGQWGRLKSGTLFWQSWCL